MNWTEILGNGWAWTVALVVVGAALMWFGRRRTTTIDPGRTLLATGDTPRRDTDLSQAAHTTGSGDGPAMAPAHEHSRSAGHRHRHGCC